MDQPDLVVTDQRAAMRYEAHIGTELAGFVEYRWVGRRRVLLHTEVLPAFGGRGIGVAMARHVLEDALASELRVTVKCPFIRVYVERHPEYAAITTPPRRHSG
ncbi:MAG: GNAT family N-acetyltransferase [Chloroflexota bacterium]